MIQELFPVNYGERQRWYQYGVWACLMPAFEYYTEILSNDPIVSRSISVFRAARLFNPKFVKLSSPIATDIDSIGDVPFLNDAGVIQPLKDEFPAYLVKAADLPNDFHFLKDTWR